MLSYRIVLKSRRIQVHDHLFAYQDMYTLPRTFFSRSLLSAVLLTLASLFGIADQSFAGPSPIAPPDTSSPRSTLRGFLESMASRFDAIQGPHGVLAEYISSGQLFLNPEQLIKIRSFNKDAIDTRGYLNLSLLPESTGDDQAWRVTIQLKEILDRIDIPPYDQIPDAETMEFADTNQWTLPNTGIRIALVEKGPHKGEYLFSPETVDAIPAYYEKLKELPYKPNATRNWYRNVFYEPSGLSILLPRLIPTRWFIHWPDWILFTFLDQPLWRWIGILILLGGLGVAFAIATKLSREGRNNRKRGTDSIALLVAPSSLVVITPIIVWLFSSVLRVSGSVHEVLVQALWILFYLALSWLIWVAGETMASGLISLERIKRSSTDCQLVRLVFRIISIAAALGSLLAGANHIGLPAYSLMAGLGISGLAVALAGQQALANLIGSLIIMLEKPFRIGDLIKTKDVAGIVEEVGFRSVRFRTSEDSLVSLPSSELVNGCIENRSIRNLLRTRLSITLNYDTKPEVLKLLIDGIKQKLSEEPAINEDSVLVEVKSFNPKTGIYLEAFFSMTRSNHQTEADYRCQILLMVKDLISFFDVKVETLEIVS